MTNKINVADLHTKIEAAGIPIEGVAYHHENGVRVDFKSEATKAQRDAAQAIVDSYDQTEVDAEKAAAEASRKAKAAADLATEAKLLASIGDESTRAVIANLLARIELLEGLLGIQHAGRTGDGVKG